MDDNDGLRKEILDLLKKHQEGLTAKKMGELLKERGCFVQVNKLPSILKQISLEKDAPIIIKKEGRAKTAGVWQLKKTQAVLAKPETAGKKRGPRPRKVLSFDDMEQLMSNCDEREQVLLQVQKNLLDCMLLIKKYFTQGV